MKTEIIKLWKEHQIKQCVMNFTCGGDSMGETDFELHLKDGELLDCQEIVDFFDDQVYNNVNFYVNSDGHYIGESGNVYITLNKNGTDFKYEKSSKEEYSESHTGVFEIQITNEEKDFLENKVLNIVGSRDECDFNYKGDLILTNEEEELIEPLSDKITEQCGEHEFEDIKDNDDEDWEEDDWFTFTSGMFEGNETTERPITMLKIEGNTLFITLTKSFTVTK